MCEVLASGDSLIVFPEGSRGTPEEMAPFQTGIAHLIQKYPQVPVIPVYLKGLGRSLPKGEFIMVPFFCDLVIGTPLFLTGSKEKITDTLETTIQEIRQLVNINPAGSISYVSTPS
jgi:1-acyl-sn-glycerol-3-phosphate acyltransferase